MDPAITISKPALRRLRLDERTIFYCSRKFIWYYRPNNQPLVTARMLATQVSDLRDAALIAIGAMQPNISRDIQKLPEDAGMTLTDRKRLSRELSAPSARRMPASPEVPVSATSAATSPLALGTDAPATVSTAMRLDDVGLPAVSPPPESSMSAASADSLEDIVQRDQMK